MASLRVFVIVLLFANLLALSLWKGWLGGELHHGEPERLSNQLNPEGIRLVGEEPRPPVRRAPVPVAPPPAVESKIEEAPAQETVAPQACVIFSGLSADQARELSARIAKAGSGFKLTEGRGEVPSSWWVHVPSQGSKDAADKKAAELRKLGVSDLFVMQEAGPSQFAISLGLYKNEAAASRQLEALKEKGVRGVQVLARGGGASRLEVRGPSDTLATVVSDLSERLRGVNRLECTP
ncbi:MAG: SPOR domain-containing protein [Rhodocyclaceae bacterium]|nr:MAG: SPOR domain-containing protein [Rhodocyclaceae bacterium]